MPDRRMWLAQAMQDQALEVQQHWERFHTHVASWQQQVSWALDKLQDLQDSMHLEELDLAEMENIGQLWYSDGHPLVNCMLDGMEETTVSEILWEKNTKFAFLLVFFVV